VRVRAGERCVLLTGFEPFGDHGVNPSAEIAGRLAGKRIAGTVVRARILPVELERLGTALDAALDGLSPQAVIALGLAAGEAVIRLERVALNLADFNMPDNVGATVRNQALTVDGPDARASRLDLPRILDRLLAQGIPARLSETAGLYLCNAAMYRLLERLPAPVPCGFIHLPLLPEQVAQRLAADHGRASERDPRLASMSLDLQLRAITAAIAAQLSSRRRSPRERP
jgi:pyroglutamyl-peptidase